MKNKFITILILMLCIAICLCNMRLEIENAKQKEYIKELEMINIYKDLKKYKQLIANIDTDFFF